MPQSHNSWIFGLQVDWNWWLLTNMYLNELMTAVSKPQKINDRIIAGIAPPGSQATMLRMEVCLLPFDLSQSESPRQMMLRKQWLDGAYRLGLGLGLRTVLNIWHNFYNKKSLFVYYKTDRPTLSDPTILDSQHVVATSCKDKSRRPSSNLITLSLCA